MNQKLNHLDLTNNDSPKVSQTSAHLFSTTLGGVKKTPTVLISNDWRQKDLKEFKFDPELKGNISIRKYFDKTNLQNLGIASLNVLIINFKNFCVSAINSSNGNIKMKKNEDIKRRILDSFLVSTGRNANKTLVSIV